MTTSILTSAWAPRRLPALRDALAAGIESAALRRVTLETLAQTQGVYLSPTAATATQLHRKARAIQTAPMFWLTPEMTHAVAAARREATEWDPARLLAPRALILFAEPLTLLPPPGRYAPRRQWHANAPLRGMWWRLGNAGGAVVTMLADSKDVPISRRTSARLTETTSITIPRADPQPVTELAGRGMPDQHVQVLRLLMSTSTLMATPGIAGRRRLDATTGGRANPDRTERRKLVTLVELHHTPQNQRHTHPHK